MTADTGDTPPLDGSAGPHTLVVDVEAPVLADADRHHLSRVVRLRDGDPLTVTDGAGRWRRCRFGDALTVDGDTMTAPAPSPRLTVACALSKGDKPEWAVQKLTELGIDRIALFPSARSVVRWDAERSARQLERLRRVAREALGQSRRVWLPEVVVWDGFATAAATPGAALAHPEGGTVPPACTTLLVGPEGGWSPEELGVELARVRLGDGVLRAETAAVVAGSALAGIRAGLMAPGA